MEEQNVRLTRGLSAVYPQFINRTASALGCWLLSSVTTPTCLCYPFSCKACPGIIFSTCRFHNTDINQAGPGFIVLTVLVKKNLCFYILLDKAVGCWTPVWCPKLLNSVYWTWENPWKLFALCLLQERNRHFIPLCELDANSTTTPWRAWFIRDLLLGHHQDKRSFSFMEFKLDQHPFSSLLNLFIPRISEKCQVPNPDLPLAFPGTAANGCQQFGFQKKKQFATITNIEDKCPEQH